MAYINKSKNKTGPNPKKKIESKKTNDIPGTPQPSNNNLEGTTTFPTDHQQAKETPHTYPSTPNKKNKGCHSNSRTNKATTQTKICRTGTHLPQEKKNHGQPCLHPRTIPIVLRKTTKGKKESHNQSPQQQQQGQHCQH